MVPRPSEQLLVVNGERVHIPKAYAEKFDKDATAIDRLYMRGVLTESEAKRARQRLANLIAAQVVR